MLHNLTVNTESANTEPMLPRKCRVRFLQASGHSFSSTHQPITLLSVCFCLETSYLICNLDSSTLNPQPVAVTQGLNKAYLTHTFSIRHFTASLCLGTIDRTSGLHLGAILTGNHQQKVQKYEKRGTK